MPDPATPLTTALLHLVRGLVLLTPLTALAAGDLILPALYQGHIAWKHFAFRILVEVAFGGWLLLAWLDARYRPRFSWLLVAASVFVAVMTVADLSGVNPEKSTWSSFGRMQGMVANLHLLGFFLVAGSVLDTGRLWARFFQVSLLACALICCEAITQYFGAPLLYDAQNVSPQLRLDARLASPVFLGVYVMLHVFLAVWCAGRTSCRRSRLAYGVLTALFIVVLYGTGTRAAWAGLLVGAVVGAVPLALRSSDPSARRRVTLAVGVFVALLTALVVVLWLNPVFVQKSLPLARLRESAMALGMRSALWEVAWLGFLDRPLLGWGEYAFSYVFDRHYDPSLIALGGAWADSPHNLVLEWLVAGGAVGLLAYLAVLAAGLRGVWSSPCRQWSLLERSTATGLIVGYVVFSTAQPDSLTAYMPLFAVFALVHSRGPTPVAPASDRRPPRAAVVVVALVVAVGVGYAVERWNLRHVRVAAALMRSIQEPVVDGELTITAALVPDSFGRSEAREQLIRVAPQLQGADLPAEMKQQVVTLAFEEIEKEIAEDPTSVRALFLAGVLMNRIGQHKRAVQYLVRARELSPKRQAIYFEIAEAQMGLNDGRKALAACDHALSLGPNSEIARSKAATIAVLAGDRAVEDEMLSWLVRRNFVFDPDPQLVDALYRKRRAQRLIEIYRPLAEHMARFYAAGRLRPARQATPKDRLKIAHVRLAGAYEMAGDRDAAAATLQRLIAADPGFEPQGRALIQGLRSGEPVNLWITRQRALPR